MGPASPAGSPVRSATRQAPGLRPVAADDLQADHRLGRQAIEPVGQVVGRADRPPVERDDGVAGLQARPCGRRTVKDPVEECPFGWRGGRVFGAPFRVRRRLRRARGSLRSRRLVGLEPDAEIGAIDEAVGTEPVGHPEGVVGGDREAEVVIATGLGPVARRDRGCHPAPDQAEPLAPEVGDDRAAVPGIEGSLDLDQAPELMHPVLQGAVEPGDMARG